MCLEDAGEILRNVGWRHWSEFYDNKYVYNKITVVLVCVNVQITRRNNRAKRLEYLDLYQAGRVDRWYLNYAI